MYGDDFTALRRDVLQAATELGYHEISGDKVQRLKDAQMSNRVPRFIGRHRSLLLDAVGGGALLICMAAIALLVVTGLLAGSQNTMLTWLQSWHASYIVGLTMLLCALVISAAIYYEKRIPNWNLSYGLVPYHHVGLRHDQCELKSAIESIDRECATNGNGIPQNLELRWESDKRGLTSLHFLHITHTLSGRSIILTPTV